MCQLQFLFKDQAQIPNQNRVMSSPRWARQAVGVPDLAKFAKCINCDFSDFWNPISHMLGAESVKDPKIKVVSYVKHYNIALVNFSMQGL